MTTLQVPSTHRAAIVQPDGSVKAEERPIPPVGDNEILVKVAAIAVNPTDWKHSRKRTRPGTIIGCDFAGTVVQIGRTLRVPVKLGDKVGGSLRGGVDNERGGFGEYAKIYSDLVWTIPEGTYNFEEAATVGIPLYTTVQAYWGPRSLQLSPVGGANQAVPDKWLLVYGGSSSVGQYAIQLAKLSGYKVVTTASKHNYTLVKSLGADFVFDYNDPDVAEQIKRVTNDGIRTVYDTISEAYTFPLIHEILNANESGKVLILNATTPDIIQKRQDVDWIELNIYTSYGPGVDPGYDENERTALSKFLWEKLPGLVGDGLKANVIKRFEGGLDNIDASLDYLQQGKASGEKIVYSI